MVDVESRQVDDEPVKNMKNKTWRINSLTRCIYDRV